jgi:hypothetical protein
MPKASWSSAAPKAPALAPAVLGGGAREVVVGGGAGLELGALVGAGGLAGALAGA